MTYPGELSRGLVLVKWWLLAIPHFLILGVLLGEDGSPGKGVGTVAGTMEVGAVARA